LGVKQICPWTIPFSSQVVLLTAVFSQHSAHAAASINP
jgi:hypothetical protein